MEFARPRTKEFTINGVINDSVFNTGSINESSLDAFTPKELNSLSATRNSDKVGFDSAYLTLAFNPHNSIQEGSFIYYLLPFD